jgi:hypothetical protein
MSDDYRKRLAAFLRLLSPRELAALRDGLAADDRRLIHGGATHPPLVGGVEHWPCEGACLLAYPRLAAGGTVLQVANYWVDLFGRLDRALGGAEARQLVNDWDNDVDRDAVRRLALLACDDEAANRVQSTEFKVQS